MFEKELPTGYDLYNPFMTEQWVLDLKNGLIYHGTLKELVYYMINNLGFSLKIICEALEDMIDKKHNAIHFGSYGNCIYTFNKIVILDKAS